MLQTSVVGGDADGYRLEHLLGCQYLTSTLEKIHNQLGVVTQKWEV